MDLTELYILNSNSLEFIFDMLNCVLLDLVLNMLL